MKKNMLLEDVNLAEIQFSSDGKSIHFDFLEMYEGKQIASLICEDVLHFIYSNCFDEDDSFACYVGEVTVQTFTSQKDIAYVFNSINYGFKKHNMDENELTLVDKLHLIEIAGGEVSIKVLCKKLQTLREA